MPPERGPTPRSRPSSAAVPRQDGGDLEQHRWQHAAGERHERIEQGYGAEIATVLVVTTLCLDLRANTATNPGSTTENIELIDDSGSFSVEVLANVVANNPNANVLFDPNQPRSATRRAV